jgi:molecular chaperone DnaK (HSP70)
MLPAQCSVTFGVADDSQFSLRFKLIEGIGHNVADYWEIGDINVKLKLPKKKGEICDVTFMISQYGIIKSKFKFENEELNEEMAFTDKSFDALLNKTYYEVIGIPEDADYNQIKKLYKEEYKKFINTRDRAKALARWVPVSEAWECLKDPNKREAYDSRLKEIR